MEQTLPLLSPSDPDKRLWLIATGVAGGAAAVATAVPFVANSQR